MITTPRKHYESLLAQNRIVPDKEQAQAVQALDALYVRLTRPWWVWTQRPRGMYLHGAVGRGKSMVMDMFCQSLPPSLPHRRVHFQAFMAQVHADLHRQRREGASDNAALLPAVAQNLARGLRVLCLDEMEVRDITDAMILARLIKALWAHGITLITTSNDAPEDLYANGLQRALFMPFIDLIRAQMEVISLEVGRDHREGGSGPAYFCPLSARPRARALCEAKGHLAHTDFALSGGRSVALETLEGADSLAWAHFAALCERALGSSDYRALAAAYSTVCIEGIPRMGYDRRNEALRFIHLIDTLYDNGNRVAIVAESPPHALYKGQDIPFARTASRLMELAHRGWRGENASPLYTNKCRVA